MNGWIRVHRQVFDHELFQGDEYSPREAWLWLIANARWKAGQGKVRASLIPLERGQMTFARSFLGNTWGWSSSRVERFLGKLETEQMIEQRSEHGQRVITICNYDDYQIEDDEGGQESEPQTEQEADSNRTANGQNYKKGKKDKKGNGARGTRLPADWVLPNEWRNWAVEAEGLTIQQATREGEKFRDHWLGASGQSGTKLDWQATWRNWVRKSKDFSKTKQANGDDWYGAFGRIPERG